MKKKFENQEDFDRALNEAIFLHKDIIMIKMLLDYEESEHSGNFNIEECVANAEYLAKKRASELYQPLIKYVNDFKKFNLDQNALNKAIDNFKKDTLYQDSNYYVISVAIATENKTFIKKYLETIDVNFGYTPELMPVLHLAIIIGNVDIVKMLLEAGADSNMSYKNILPVELFPVYRIYQDSLDDNGLDNSTILEIYKLLAQYNAKLNERTLAWLLATPKYDTFAPTAKKMLEIFNVQHNSASA